PPPPIRDGDRADRGAAGGSEHSVGAAKPCVRGESIHFGMAADSIPVRLAAAPGRRAQDRLRPAAACTLRQREGAGGGPSARARLAQKRFTPDRYRKSGLWALAPWITRAQGVA